jgi:hypothetical protein
VPELLDELNDTKGSKQTKSQEEKERVKLMTIPYTNWGRRRERESCYCCSHYQFHSQSLISLIDFFIDVARGKRGNKDVSLRRFKRKFAAVAAAVR